MAKIRYGAVAVEARGSAAGLNFSLARAGYIVRSRPTHTDLSSPTTTLQRSRLATLLPRWINTLSEAQRADWRTLANANPRDDVFGNPYYLTGTQLYLSVNTLRASLALAPLDDAPPDVTVDPLLTLSISVATAPATLTLAFTPTPLPAGYRLYVYASPSLSPGLAITDRLYFCGASPLADVSPFAAGALYVARLGDLRASRRVFVRAATERDTRGTRSPFLTATALIT